MPYDSVLFTVIVVVIAFIVMVMSAKLLLRAALFVVSFLIIWYVLFYVGLVPSPEHYFKDYEVPKIEAPKPETSKSAAGLPRFGR